MSFSGRSVLQRHPSQVQANKEKEKRTHRKRSPSLLQEVLLQNVQRPGDDDTDELAELVDDENVLTFEELKQVPTSSSPPVTDRSNFDRRHSHQPRSGQQLYADASFRLLGVGLNSRTGRSMAQRALSPQRSGISASGSYKDIFEASNKSFRETGSWDDASLEPVPSFTRARKASLFSSIDTPGSFAIKSIPSEYSASGLSDSAFTGSSEGRSSEEGDSGSSIGDNDDFDVNWKSDSDMDEPYDERSNATIEQARNVVRNSSIYVDDEFLERIREIEDTLRTSTGTREDVVEVVSIMMGMMKDADLYRLVARELYYMESHESEQGFFDSFWEVSMANKYDKTKKRVVRANSDNQMGGGSRTHMKHKSNTSIGSMAQLIEDEDDDMLNVVTAVPVDPIGNSNLYFWNTRYQRLLDQRQLVDCSSFEQENVYILLQQELRALTKSFRFAAENYAKIIVSEFFLSPKEKSLKPNKPDDTKVFSRDYVSYSIQGMEFRVYHGPRNLMRTHTAAHKMAAKSARSHLYLDRFRSDQLRLPLMIVIDYAGFRVIALGSRPNDVDSSSRTTLSRLPKKTSKMSHSQGLGKKMSFIGESPLLPTRKKSTEDSQTAATILKHNSESTDRFGNEDLMKPKAGPKVSSKGSIGSIGSLGDICELSDGDSEGDNPEEVPEQEDAHHSSQRTENIAGEGWTPANVLNSVNEMAKRMGISPFILRSDIVSLFNVRQRKTDEEKIEEESLSEKEDAPKGTSHKGRVSPTISKKGSQAVLSTKGSQAILSTKGSQAVLSTKGSQAVLKSKGSVAVLKPKSSIASLVKLNQQRIESEISNSSVGHEDSNEGQEGRESSSEYIDDGSTDWSVIYFENSSLSVHKCRDGYMYFEDWDDILPLDQYSIDDVQQAGEQHMTPLSGSFRTNTARSIRSAGSGSKLMYTARNSQKFLKDSVSASLILRPEFVLRQSHTSLTTFEQQGDIPPFSFLEQCLIRMHEHTIPSFAQEILSRDFDTFRIDVEMHSRGLCMRHLGILRSSIPPDAPEKIICRRFLLSEMAARTLKSHIRKRLRQTVRNSSFPTPDIQMAIGAVVHLLNSFLRDQRRMVLFGDTSLAAELSAKFYQTDIGEIIPGDLAEDSRSTLSKVLDIVYVISRLNEMCELAISETSLDCLNDAVLDLARRDKGGGRKVDFDFVFSDVDITLETLVSLPHVELNTDIFNLSWQVSAGLSKRKMSDTSWALRHHLLQPRGMRSLISFPIYGQVLSTWACRVISTFLKYGKARTLVLPAIEVLSFTQDPHNLVIIREYMWTLFMVWMKKSRYAPDRSEMLSLILRLITVPNFMLWTKWHIMCLNQILLAPANKGNDKPAGRRMLAAYGLLCHVIALFKKSGNYRDGDLFMDGTFVFERIPNETSELNAKRASHGPAQENTVVSKIFDIRDIIPSNAELHGSSEEDIKFLQEKYKCIAPMTEAEVEEVEKEDIKRPRGWKKKEEERRKREEEKKGDENSSKKEVSDVQVPTRVHIRSRRMSSVSDMGHFGNLQASPQSIQSASLGSSHGGTSSENDSDAERSSAIQRHKIVEHMSTNPTMIGFHEERESVDDVMDTQFTKDTEQDQQQSSLKSRSLKYQTLKLARFSSTKPSKPRQTQFSPYLSEVRMKELMNFADQILAGNASVDAPLEYSTQEEKTRFVGATNRTKLIPEMENASAVTKMLLLNQKRKLGQQLPKLAAAPNPDSKQNLKFDIIDPYVQGRGDIRAAGSLEYRRNVGRKMTMPGLKDHSTVQYFNVQQSHTMGETVCTKFNKSSGSGRRTADLAIEKYIESGGKVGSGVLSPREHPSVKPTDMTKLEQVVSFRLATKVKELGREAAMDDMDSTSFFDPSVIRNLPPYCLYPYPTIESSSGDSMLLNVVIRMVPYLDLTGSRVDCSAIAKSLQKNDSLTGLRLTTCALQEKDAHILAASLNQNKQLTFLDIAENDIGAEGAQVLGKAINRHARLDNVYFTIEKFLPISLLKRNTGPTLDVEGMDLSPEDMIVLCEQLLHNRSITQAHMSRNMLSLHGSNSLARVIKHHKHLVYLDVAFTDLGPDGGRALARTMGENSTLTYLDVSRNSLFDDGSIALLKSFTKNKTLRTIDLSKNKTSTESRHALRKLVENHPALTDLRVGNNNLGDECIKDLFGGLLQHGCPVESVSVACTSMTSVGAPAVEKVLRANTALKNIDLHDNMLGVKGVTTITYGIKQNTVLETLDLSENNILPEGIVEMYKAMEVGECYARVDMTKNVTMKQQVRKLLSEKSLGSGSANGVDELISF